MNIVNIYENSRTPAAFSVNGDGSFDLILTETDFEFEFDENGNISNFDNNEFIEMLKILKKNSENFSHEDVDWNSDEAIRGIFSAVKNGKSIFSSDCLSSGSLWNIIETVGRRELKMGMFLC